MIKFRHYLLMGAALLLISFIYQHITFGKEKYERIIDSDGKGYYAYLPAIFIYHDLSFGFYFKKENEPIVRYFDERFLTRQGEFSVIKTYCGEALLLLPFFAAGCLTQFVTTGHVNGFDPLIQFFICMGAIFYLCLGLFVLHRLLKANRFSDSIAFTTTAVICLGTNLLTYSVFYPTMSHVYSFSMIACFLFLCYTFDQNPSQSNLLLLSVLLAFVILVRPINAILAVFPLSFLNKKLLAYILKNSQPVLLSTLCFLLLLSIQPALNYLQCHQFFPWSYGDEGFYFNNPQFAKMLFSFRNGMFIYSPALWLLIPGFILLLFKDTRFAIASLLTIGISFYFIAAWWNWSSEPALGNRSCIDWYAFFALPVASVLAVRKNVFKKIGYLFLAAAIMLNFIFTWQYLRDIIHPDGMNFAKFKYVFLKTSGEYYGCLGNGNEESYLPAEKTPFFFYSTPNDSFHRDDVFAFNDTIKSGLIIEIPEYRNLMQPMKAVVTLERFEEEFKACTEAFVIFDYTDKSNNLYYRENLRINDLPRKKLNEWKYFEYGFVMPALKSPDDKLTFKIDNSQGRKFRVKNLHVEVFHFVRK